VGPAEGGCDQRRRSIYSFDDQSITLERLVYISGGIVLLSGLLQTACCNGLLDQTLFSGLRRQHPCCPDACFTCKTCMLFAEAVIFSPTHVHLHAHAAHKGCTAACARAWRSLLCILLASPNYFPNTTAVNNRASRINPGTHQWIPRGFFRARLT
jgi:hypothetical protein